MHRRLDHDIQISFLQDVLKVSYEFAMYHIMVDTADQSTDSTVWDHSSIASAKRRVRWSRDADGLSFVHCVAALFLLTGIRGIKEKNQFFC